MSDIIDLQEIIYKLPVNNGKYSNCYDPNGQKLCKSCYKNPIKDIDKWDEYIKFDICQRVEKICNPNKNKLNDYIQNKGLCEYCYDFEILQDVYKRNVINRKQLINNNPLICRCKICYKKIDDSIKNFPSIYINRYEQLCKDCESVYISILCKKIRCIKIKINDSAYEN